MGIALAVTTLALLLCAGLPALRALLDRSPAPHTPRPSRTTPHPERLDEWRPRDPIGAFRPFIR